MKFKSSRLGHVNRQIPVKSVISLTPAPVPPTAQNKESLITSSYRGISTPQLNQFFDKRLLANPIVSNHIEQIFLEYIEGRSESTLKISRKKIRNALFYIDKVKSALNCEINCKDDFTPSVSSAMLAYAGNDDKPYSHITDIRRFLKTIGVEKALIPLNTKRQPIAQEKNGLPASLLKAMIKHFKFEMNIIRARYDERLMLLERASKPKTFRKKAKRLFDDPAERITVLLTEIGIEIQNVMTARKNGLRDWMAVFEQQPGAMCLLVDNEHRRVGGITGHLAWFYPSQRDLLPFVMLLLIRTRFGYSQIAGLSYGNYNFRHLALEWNGKPNSIVQIATPKYRSKNHADDEPEMVHAITLIRPNSHTYQIVKFLEKLSEPLRVEVRRQIVDLRALSAPSSAEVELLARLDRIQNDLFIYRAEATIYSLSLYDEMPLAYRKSLEQLDFPTNSKQIRSSELAAGVKLFGGDAAMATILGDHRGPRTFRHYTNDREIREKSEARFIEIFEKSVSLVTANAYSQDNLKTILEAQGLSPEEISVLLSAGLITHWGNRCASPKFPPPGFGKSTVPGKLCVEQNCIDGCPRARWLPDAVDILKSKIEQIESEIESASFLSTANSVLHDWLERCKRLLTAIEERTQR